MANKYIQQAWGDNSDHNIQSENCSTHFSEIHKEREVEVVTKGGRNN